MVVDELKKLFETQKEVKFKLYSLEYIIKELDEKISVYPILYETRKNYYNSIDEALNNYTVYNESLMENQDRMTLMTDNEK